MHNNAHLSTIVWTTQLANAYVTEYVCTLSQDFMSILVPRQPHFVLQVMYIYDFPIVYVGIGINDMLGDHRLCVDRKLYMFTNVN